MRTAPWTRFTTTKKMTRPQLELADVVRNFGQSFIDQHQPNGYQMRVLNAIEQCRTAALGGHLYACDNCGLVQISYNSCRNRHCPKCQGSNQTAWVDALLLRAYPVQHYHLVFTVPECLNAVCMADSRWFYNKLFDAVWQTLRAFGYSKYGVETGAVCVLHTWGQNLSLHPHIHCLVPALGYDLRQKFKAIGKKGGFLFSVHQLSLSFQGRLLAAVKAKLKSQNRLHEFKAALEKAYATQWVVFCQPSFAGAEHVIRYLGQYTHRVAISNSRILKMDDKHVTFNMKDYADHSRVKPLTISGTEFLRRFCLHILPKSFVRIRYFGIYSSRFRSKAFANDQDLKLPQPKPATKVESVEQTLSTAVFCCPACQKGRMVAVAVIPRARSPDSPQVSQKPVSF